MSIKIEKELCTGCGACIKVCLYDGVDILDKKAILNDSCIHCAACIDSCKFKAIKTSEEQISQKDLAAYSGVLVFAETKEHGVSRVAFELLGCGRRLADLRKAQLHAVVIGKAVERFAGDLISHGADIVHIVEDRQLGNYRNGPFSRVLTTVIRDVKPEIVLFATTIIGRDLAPRVANRLKTGLTADCTGLDIEEGTGLLLQTRPAFGGNVMATIVCPNHRPQMSTVRPGVMKSLPPDESRKGEVKKHKVAIKDADLKAVIKEAVKTVARQVDLSEAEIIVSGGRGVGSAEKFSVIRQLAETIGAQVGGSRAAVEAGWIPPDHQVGQTGKSVSPKLYIACGISGAIQHLAGISGADFILAVNRDPEAPIMKAADLGIVGDLHKVVPLLTAEFQRMRKEEE